MTASMAVFLCLNNEASSQELFDPTYSQPLEEQEVCKTDNAKASLQNDIDNMWAQRTQETTESRRYTSLSISWTNRWCEISYEGTYNIETRTKDYDGNWGDWSTRVEHIRNSKNGYIEKNPMCDINSEYSYQHDDRCWNPEDLEERDSCPSDSILPSLPDTLGRASNVCLTLPDGSRCAFKKSSDGEVFEYNSSLSCYEFNFEEYQQPDTTPPADNECQTITNGNVTSTFCPANPDAVCPNGLCQPSCGSFDIGYGEQFGCFSTGQNQCDMDGDGFIDDACIVPPPSCDVEPNQPHCPTSPTPVNCSENPEHEYCQNPPPSCEENPAQEGCGTTEPPTTEPPTDTIEGLEQIRGEQQKTNELLSGVKAGIEGVKSEVKGVKTSVDKLTDEQKKTTEATKEVGGAIVGLKNTLNNTGGVSMGISPSEGLNGWYESEYPEGFTSVMETVSPLYNASKLNQYLDSWKVTVSGEYSFPQICLDIGIANYGCHSLEIDNRVFPFIRIIMIVSALFLARQLVFGG